MKWKGTRNGCGCGKRRSEPSIVTRLLTGREGDEESPAHEQNVQNHQPGITCRQHFIGTHPYSRVFRPIRWRGGWIQLEIFLFIPFGLDLSVVRVTVIMLSCNCEGERKDQEESFCRGRGTLHPWNWKRERRMKRWRGGKVNNNQERRFSYIRISGGFYLVVLLLTPSLSSSARP